MLRVAKAIGYAYIIIISRQAAPAKCLRKSVLCHYSLKAPPPPTPTHGWILCGWTD